MHDLMLQLVGQLSIRFGREYSDKFMGSSLGLPPVSRRQAGSAAEKPRMPGSVPHVIQHHEQSGGRTRFSVIALVVLKLYR